jgi:hypothetical protein
VSVSRPGSKSSSEPPFTAVVAHVVLAGPAAAAITAGSKTGQATVQVWSEWLEGSADSAQQRPSCRSRSAWSTIFKVLGFQAIRIRELPAESPRGRKNPDGAGAGRGSGDLRFPGCIITTRHILS